MSSGAWDLQSITTMWASIGHTDTNWTAKAAAFVLNVVIKGFRFIGLFALFPIYLFCIMEFAGYIVLLTTGRCSRLTQACATTSVRLPSASNHASPPAPPSRPRPAACLRMGQRRRSAPTSCVRAFRQRMRDAFLLTNSYPLFLLCLTRNCVATHLHDYH